MKRMHFFILAGAAVIMLFCSTSAWADGRNRGNNGYHRGGHDYHQGYQKHRGHHYRPRPLYRRRNPPRPYTYKRPYPRHYRPYYYGYGFDGYWMLFSIGDPYFSFGFSTGGRW